MKMQGTELKVISPAAIEVLGPTIDRAPQLRTNANDDYELLETWLKAHKDGSAHTRRAYERTGRRFLDALGRNGIRFATVEDIQSALDVMRTTESGTEAKPATVNSYVAAVKSFLGFAHQVGYTRFNAGPVIKLRKAPRQLAQRLMSEFDTQRLIHAAEGRDRLMLEVAYYGALRVSELVS